MQENNLDTEPFEDVQKYLPESTYLISNEEINKRVDLRYFYNVQTNVHLFIFFNKIYFILHKSEDCKRPVIFNCRNRCIFTIDPPSARDLDDAFSCSVLNDGFVNVGIHIADVSHYVLPNTPLDDNVRDKATSVYLTEKVSFNSFL